MLASTSRSEADGDASKRIKKRRITRDVGEENGGRGELDQGRHDGLGGELKALEQQLGDIARQHADLLLLLVRDRHGHSLLVVFGPPKRRRGSATATDCARAYSDRSEEKLSRPPVPPRELASIISARLTWPLLLGYTHRDDIRALRRRDAKGRVEPAG